MKTNSIRIQDTNQEVDFGQCTQGKVELSLQDLQEIGNAEVAYLVNKNLLINNLFK